jgi:hypothetical protein
MGRRISRSSESTLRKLAIAHDSVLEQAVCPESGSKLAGAHGLDERTIALARVAALVALDGDPPSYQRECNAALASGATTDEIVGVLVRRFAGGFGPDRRGRPTARHRRGVRR